MSKRIHKKHFNKMCRICLSQNMQLVSITSKIVKMIKTCTSVKVKSNDGLPSHVCVECIDDIKKFYDFKFQCMQSDQLLKKVLDDHCELKTNNKSKSLPVNDTFADSILDDIKIETKKADENFIKNENDDDNYDDTSPVSPDQTDIKEEKETSLVKSETDNIQEPEETYPCKVCNKILGSEYSLLRHMKMQGHDGDKEYTCEMCKESFYKIRGLSEHMKTHGVKPLVCPVCKKQFMLKVQLEIHRKFHDKFACQQCSKVFKNANNLNRHQVTHSNETPFRCSQCDKSFKSESYLANHTKLVHYGIKRRSVCTICGISVAHIKQHLLVHQGLKPFKCTECDASFMTSGHLNAHSRKHSGEVQIYGTLCTICGKKCRHSTQLRIHMRKHTGERPHVCTYCSKAYKTGSALTVHVRSAHTGERPHLCSMCNKTFTTSDTLKQHIRTHTGERPFVCQVCGRGFTQRHALKTHMKIHNSDC